MRQLVLDIRPDAPPVFGNYLTGPNTECVHALQERIADAAPYAGEHVVYLWGEAGVGKSHLLQAWARAGHAPYYPGPSLPDADPSRFAVDDVQLLSGAGQVRLFSLLNHVREQGGRIIAAGTLPPSQLTLRPDLATRLAQGLVYRLLPLSDAHKTEALRIRAAARGFSLDDDLLRYMLHHCRRDLPHLLAIVDGLDQFSLSRKRAATLALLKEYLHATAG